jgi:hypothetical protein
MSVNHSNRDDAPAQPTESSSYAVEVKVIAVSASSEINQNVGSVFGALAELQVAVVLPYRHRLVYEPPNLSDFSAVARDVLVHKSDTTREGRNRKTKFN